MNKKILMGSVAPHPPAFKGCAVGSNPLVSSSCNSVLLSPLLHSTDVRSTDDVIPFQGKHQTNICDRWNQNKAGLASTALFNGIGMESWENVWGKVGGEI